MTSSYLKAAQSCARALIVRLRMDASMAVTPLKEWGGGGLGGEAVCFVPCLVGSRPLELVSKRLPLPVPNKSPI